jgi:hypothetical protein
VKFSRSEPGFVVSAAAHIGLIAAALFVFSGTKKFEDAQETVPVDVVTDSQFNQIMKGEKTAREVKPTPRVHKVSTEPEFKPEPPLAEAKRDVQAPPPALKRLRDPGDDDAPLPRKKTAALPPPAPPPPPARPSPEPAPTPPAKPQAKTQPEPEKEASADAEVVRPKPPPRPKLDKEAKDAAQKRTPPRKAEPRLKVDEVAKLLEKKKFEEKPVRSKPTEEKNADAAARPKSGDENAPKSRFNAASIASLLSHETPQRRASTGREVTHTASLGSPTANAPKMSPSLQAQIDAYTIEHYSKCWREGLSMNARTYVPEVEFRLTRDGALEGAPRLLNPSSNPVDRSRGEQALAAVRRCSPMPIPAAFEAFYDYWRVTELHMKEDM